MNAVMGAASVLIALSLTSCGGARIDQKFTRPANRPEAQFNQDRYECMQRHDSTSNFIACMESRGYSHVK